MKNLFHSFRSYGYSIYLETLQFQKKQIGRDHNHSFHPCFKFSLCPHVRLGFDCGEEERQHWRPAHTVRMKACNSSHRSREHSKATGCIDQALQSSVFPVSLKFLYRNNSFLSCTVPRCVGTGDPLSSCLPASDSRSCHSFARAMGTQIFRYFFGQFPNIMGLLENKILNRTANSLK